MAQAISPLMGGSTIEASTRFPVPPPP